MELVGVLFRADSRPNLTSLHLQVSCFRSLLASSRRPVTVSRSKELPCFDIAMVWNFGSFPCSKWEAKERARHTEGLERHGAPSAEANEAHGNAGKKEKKKNRRGLGSLKF